eukprot:UN00241
MLIKNVSFVLHFKTIQTISINSFSSSYYYCNPSYAESCCDKCNISAVLSPLLLLLLINVEC